MTDAPEFYAPDRPTWRKWLMKNHDKHTAVWLTYDLGPDRKLKWEDIVQEALCFGWIDSKGSRVSSTQSKIYVCKRKPTSGWSKLNKEHVNYLTAHNLMQPAGQKVIDQAKENGSWTLYDKAENMELPPELTALLAKNKDAKIHFDNFSPSARKVILSWIYMAKRDETRQARIAKTVEMAAQNLKAYG